MSGRTISLKVMYNELDLHNQISVMSSQIKIS